MRSGVDRGLLWWALGPASSQQHLRSLPFCGCELFPLYPIIECGSLVKMMKRENISGLADHG